MAPTEELLEFSLNITPEMVMFVPEEGMKSPLKEDWNVLRHEKHLEQMIQKLLQRGIMVSVFIDADKEQIKAPKILEFKFVRSIPALTRMFFIVREGTNHPQKFKQS